MVRNTFKSKFTNNVWGIAFEGECLWSFGNGFATNVVIFGFNNSSSSDTDNRKNNFLVLKISIDFSKANTNFCLILHYNGHESYFYVNKIKTCKFRANGNISWYNFWLQSVSKDFTKDEKSETSLNSTVYDFNWS